MMKRVFALIIIFLIFLISTNIAAAVAFSPADIEWAAPVKSTLYMGGTMVNGDFRVKAVQFSSPVPGVKKIDNTTSPPSTKIVPETDVDPMVFLEIYKDGSLLKEIVLNKKSEPYIDPDYEVKVSADDFLSEGATEWVYEYYKPWAAINISLRGKPKLEVTITTDKPSYTSNRDMVIKANITVKNSGDAKVRNVDVNFDPAELKLRGGDTRQLHQYYYELKKGESAGYDVILIIPDVLDTRTFKMDAEAVGTDVKDIINRSNISREISVSPEPIYFTISKSLKDRMYLTDTVVVTLKVENSGRFDAYDININDSLNENFELSSSTLLNWHIPVLKVGGEWTQTYSIKPLETNLDGFIISGASVNYTINNRQNSTISKTTTLIVNGPLIILNKTVDKEVVNISEEINVSLNVTNVGNIATRVKVKDSIPDDVSLVSGTTDSPPMFLELNSPNWTNYTIRMEREGEFQLPAAIANYTGVEYRGITRSRMYSQTPVIKVIDPSKVKPSSGRTENITESIETPQGTELPPETGSEQESQQGSKTESKQESQPGRPWRTVQRENTSENAEPTPTPITPGFEMLLAAAVLILMARKR